MNRKSLPDCQRWLIFLLCATGTFSGAARSNAIGDDPMKGQLVKTGLYVISGGGSNSVLRLSADGLIVVDGKLPGNYAALAKQVRKISDQSVRILILTDHAESRTGTNAEFVKAGTQIVAHENSAGNLAGDNATGQESAASIKTYGEDFSGRLGGVEVRVMHFGDAHTNGDSVVYFPDLKAIAIGDLYVAAGHPVLATGGSLTGWSQALAGVLKLEFDVVVPGTGPVITRAELEAFRARLDGRMPVSADLDAERREGREMHP